MEKDIEEVRAHARAVAEAHSEEGNEYGWFEALYAEASGEAGHIPWGDLAPNRFLAEWESGSPLQGEGRTALVVGCGLGDDAEFLAERGFDVTAFDVSPTAIEWAKKLYPSEKITFTLADLFNAPSEWSASFNLVLEVYTVQALPDPLREAAIKAISGFVKPGGELVVVTRVREDDEEPEGPPWPLSEAGISSFGAQGLSFEERMDFPGDENVPQRKAVLLLKKSDSDSV